MASPPLRDLADHRARLVALSIASDALQPAGWAVLDLRGLGALGRDPQAAGDPGP